MRIITTILLFVCFHANATIYYVSNSGNDAAVGTTTVTSWQSLSKVNGYAFNSGDSILLNKGDSWNEQLIPPRSNLYFGSYGTGAKPIITGFQAVTGWINEGGNIWSATFDNSVRYQNTVYINGALRAKGRYPNYGWLTIQSHIAKTQITGTLTGTPNYTGGEVVIRNNHWTLDHLPITNQTGGTIDIGNDPKTGIGIFYNLIDGNGYFIQNKESVLDTLNEWCYDTTTKTIKVYATSEPSVKASTIDTLVYMNGEDYITFSDIQFEGSNMVSFILNASTNTIFTNCDIIDHGGDGIQGEAIANFTFQNSTMDRIWNDGIVATDWYGSSSNSSINNSSFKNIGTKHGMGSNRFGTYTGVYFSGDKLIFRNNVLDNIGYIGLYFFGDSVSVENNEVSNFCFIKDDGAGIYTWMGGGVKPLGGIVRNNIVHDGLTASDGNAESSLATSGIYMDNETNYVTVDSNTVTGMPLAGIFLHIVDNINVKNNTLVNNNRQLKIEFGTNVSYKHNIMYATAAAGAAMELRITTMVSDSNYFLNEVDTTRAASLFGNYTLKRWQDSGYDIHSSRHIDSGITAATPVLLYNASTAATTTPLPGTYIDAIGGTYINSITFQPFKSALLFKSITDIVVADPIIPNKLNRKLKFQRVKLH